MVAALCHHSAEGISIWCQMKKKKKKGKWKMKSCYEFRVCHCVAVWSPSGTLTFNHCEEVSYLHRSRRIIKENWFCDRPNFAMKLEHGKQSRDFLCCVSWWRLSDPRSPDIEIYYITTRNILICNKVKLTKSGLSPGSADDPRLIGNDSAIRLK